MIGVVIMLLVAAVLLFLALASYSPLDASLNTAADPRCPIRTCGPSTLSRQRTTVAAGRIGSSVIRLVSHSVGQSFGRSAKPCIRLAHCTATKAPLTRGSIQIDIATTKPPVSEAISIGSIR